MSSFKKFQQAKQQKENKAKPRGGWDEDDNSNNRITSANNTFGYTRSYGGISNIASPNFGNSLPTFSPSQKYQNEKKPEFDVKSVIHVENKLLEDLIVPSGISLKPNENQLKDFVKRCKSLDKQIIFNFLMDKLNNYANYNSNQEIKSFCKCLYVIEAILTARVEELYQGFHDYRELFEEIQNHFSDNKKVLDILNTIFLALGMQITSTSNKPNSNLLHNNQNTTAQVSSSNQSNINLFEGFVTENKNTNLISNDLFGNPNYSNKINTVTSGVDLLNLNQVNQNNTSNQSNLHLFGFETNNNKNNFNLNTPTNQISGLDLLNPSTTNAINGNNLISASDNTNASSNNTKAFSFIKNKNSSSNNQLINVHNSNTANTNSLFDNANTSASFQSQQRSSNSNSNPNDFTDLFGSLKLNGANKKTESILADNNLINNNNSNLNLLQPESNTVNAATGSKKGFSFIKKEKQQANSNEVKSSNFLTENKRTDLDTIFSLSGGNNIQSNTNPQIIDLSKMNQPSIDEIFDSRKTNNSNIDLSKLDKIYSETSQDSSVSNSLNANNNIKNNKDFNPNQIENLMNQHFNYNHVYNNIEHGKKEIDPFSFVDDMLKPKKI